MNFTAPEPFPGTFNPLRRFASVAMWALPVWASLLFVSTLTQHPDPATEFEAYAEYITTERFLLSHIFASIVGAGLGTLGFFALFITLSATRMGTLPLVALVASVLGNTLITAVFGVAAFAQPAINKAYVASETAQAMAFDEDVYGVPLSSRRPALVCCCSPSASLPLGPRHSVPACSRASRASSSLSERCSSRLSASSSSMSCSQLGDS